MSKTAFPGGATVDPQKKERTTQGGSETEFSTKPVQFDRFGPRDRSHRIPHEISRFLASGMSKMDGKVPKSAHFWCPGRNVQVVRFFAGLPYGGGKKLKQLTSHSLVAPD